MGEMIRFERPDGKDCPAYLATPSGNPTAPGFVVIQEWWGLNPQIKGVADRLADAGYRALVPDLFRGKLTTRADEASHWMASLDFKDAAEQDIRGAAQYLKRESKKVAIGGFCMGGALTIVSAVNVPEMDAGACFYGIPPARLADPKEIRIPMIYHFAARDDWCTPAVVDKLAGTLPKQPEQTIFRYEAQHAFMNEARPEVYDPEATQLAWQRTIVFLKRTIG